LKVNSGGLQLFSIGEQASYLAFWCTGFKLKVNFCPSWWVMSRLWMNSRSTEDGVHGEQLFYLAVVSSPWAAGKLPKYTVL
jgi:hypothetical protein